MDYYMYLSKAVILLPIAAAAASPRSPLPVISLLFKSNQCCDKISAIFFQNSSLGHTIYASR
jgi:hypothetical protein